jgi:hypothetical protein
MRNLRSVVFVFAYFVVISGVVVVANAQATRTWVSGVGDDVNPCSRTAPCKTFAGTISKTAVNGVINCLDPGGFGAITITKSISIDCSTGTAGVLVSGTNGIIINITNSADAGTVRLKGLLFNGLTSGINGVSILAASRVYIEDCIIDGFDASGVTLDATAAPVALTVTNARLVNNRQFGVHVAPASAGSANVAILNSQIVGNGIGISQSGMARMNVQDTSISGGATGVLNSEAEITMLRTTVFNNGVGLQSTFSGNIRIAGSSIIDNSTGLLMSSRGKIISYLNNVIDGNTVNGAPNATATLQ